jgi:hypothetical protein
VEIGELTQTADPAVWIEEQRPGYVRYVDAEGRRWEIEGSCDRRGDCLIGAVIDGEVVRDHAHLAEIDARKPGRIDSDLDVPVTPGFSGCCELVGRWL